MYSGDRTERMETAWDRTTGLTTRDETSETTLKGVFAKNERGYKA